MIEIIASITFFGSVAAAAVIFARKMPQAMRMADSRRELGAAGLFFGVKNWFAGKIKEDRRLKDFSWRDLAQKQLLKARVLVLKAENKINDYMVKLRRHSETQHRESEIAADKYWHDIKNIVKSKKTALQKTADGLIQGKTVEIKTQKKDSGGIGETESIVVKTALPDQASAKTSRPKRKRVIRKKKTADPFAW